MTVDREHIDARSGSGERARGALGNHLPHGVEEHDGLAISTADSHRRAVYDNLRTHYLIDGSFGVVDENLLSLAVLEGGLGLAESGHFGAARLEELVI